MARSRSIICVLVMACSLTGCSEGPGGSSPEAVFQRQLAAAQAKDWAGMFACIDPEQSDQLLMGATLGVGLAGMKHPDLKEKVEAIFKKHGVVKPDKPPMFGGRKAMQEAAQKAFANVADKPALFADIATIMAGLPEANLKQMTFEGAVLKDVTTEGDTAKGTVSIDGKDRPIYFAQREGRWYVRMQK